MDIPQELFSDQNDLKPKPYIPICIKKMLLLTLEFRMKTSSAHYYCVLRGTFSSENHSSNTLQVHILLVKKATFRFLLFPMLFQCTFGSQKVLVVNDCIKCSENNVKSHKNI